MAAQPETQPENPGMPKIPQGLRYFVLGGDFENFEQIDLTWLKENVKYKDLPIIASLLALEACNAMPNYIALEEKFDEISASMVIEPVFEQDLETYEEARDDLVAARDKLGKLKKTGVQGYIDEIFITAYREVLGYQEGETAPKPAALQALDELAEQSIIGQDTHSVASKIVKIVGIYQMNILRKNT